MLSLIVMIIVYMLTMILIHELGHVIAIYLIGGRLKKFEYSWSSIKGVYSYPENLTFKKYIFFTINGVSMQLLASLVFILSVNDTIWVSFALFYFSIISINLVPLSTTDGAFIFKAYPSKKIKNLLWFLVGLLFILSLSGLVFLWKDKEAESYTQLGMTLVYLLMLILSTRRMVYLHKEEYYGNKAIQYRKKGK
ncbi:hypothetical protein X927_06045 [Petrotoga mexicana DSM 14811]|uniref:Peptidase M50 n=1 Tax=Petrotoga mexicana DSM 14811 TaxID=1122954 RepID=A0A2K1P8W5_9BACT|nr:hypothetical protein X927_06045 [Petrotoga mexicana DSM 14811]